MTVYLCALIRGSLPQLTTLSDGGYVQSARCWERKYKTKERHFQGFQTQRNLKAGRVTLLRSAANLLPPKIAQRFSEATQALVLTPRWTRGMHAAKQDDVSANKPRRARKPAARHKLKSERLTFSPVFKSLSSFSKVWFAQVTLISTVVIWDSFGGWSSIPKF